MKKIDLVIVLFLISISLLFIQVLILQALITKEEKETTVDPTWKLIHEVTSIANRQGVPLFLIDPVILSHIQNATSSGNPGCHILCFGQTITQFATIGTSSTQLQKDNFLEELEKNDIKHLVFSSHDPILLRHDLKVIIPIHYIIFQNSHIIHIAVFYERPGKFWWYPPLHISEDQWQDLKDSSLDDSDIKFNNNARAYEMCEIPPVTIDDIRMFLPVTTSIFLQPNSDIKFMECNYAGAKTFYEQNGKDESEEAESFRVNARKLLTKAKTLLDYLKVPFWLSSGTCLGFYRQCDFIPYSKDVDIGIWIKDYKHDIVPTFSTHDLPLTHSFGKVEDSFELSFRDGDIKLDIFFFYEEHDYVWNGGTQARTGKKFKYIFSKFHLCWTEFLELKVRVPCEIKDYIEANYGPKWMEPVKIWDWKNSPPNVKENGQWPVEEWPEVIQLFPLPEQT